MGRVGGSPPGLPLGSVLRVMAAETLGNDAYAMTLKRRRAYKTEAAMHFFSSSQFPSAPSTLPQQATATSTGGQASARKLDCGWYDSSFDLARGLEVSEDDNDALYQLWALSRN